MKPILYGAVAVAISLLMTACGSDKNKTVEENAPEVTADENSDLLRSAVESHDRKQLPSMIEEMALFADDLTPRQAVSVLMGYYELHLQYAAEHRYKNDLETIRNFVDVYDIANGNHGSDFKDALKSTRDVYPDVDFSNLYVEFAERLNNYAGGTGVEAAAEKPDTTAVDSLSAGTNGNELPPELRPAE